MAGRNIWYGYGAIDSDPKNPSPTVSVDLAKTSRVNLETLGMFLRV
jgi:hypothetical protein